MYQLIRNTPLRQLLMRQAPNLGVSFLVAELFYKFHSFTLECAAFLATWFVLDIVVESVSRLWRQARVKPSEEGQIG